MDNCYLCGKEFDNKNVKKHDEHIIQQAVGGNLTENDILCSKCGGKLGQEVDVPFNKIFDGIATRLNIRKERKKNKYSTVKCKYKKNSDFIPKNDSKYINIKYKLMQLSWFCENKKLDLFDFQYHYNEFCKELKKIDVVWENFKVYPVKPFHKYTNDKKKVIIYGNRKIAKQYKKIVEKEISKKFQKDNKPEIIICDDLEGMVEYSFDMDNQSFKRGLAKIAIGFASKHNIKREDLPLVLEIDKKTKQGEIKDAIPTIQFYPLSIIDILIEIQKNEFDHYPFHNLILFTLDYNLNNSNSKKVLICYIELFSTFQFYVILNDNYYGKSLYKYYAQDILKKEENKVNINWRRYYKERNLYLEPLNITEEDIDRKYSNYIRKFFSKLKWSINTNTSILKKQASFLKKMKSHWDIEEELIQHATDIQSYIFDFEDYICKIIKRIDNQVMIMKQKEQFFKSELKDTHFGNFLNNQYLMSTYDMFEDFENIISFKQNLDLFFSERYNEEYDEIFSIDSYRKIYVENGSLKNYTDLIKYAEILTNSQAFRVYGHKKVFMLSDYIFKENIKQKTKQQQ